MSTIEERANINFANGIITNRHDYIEGATEQREVDDKINDEAFCNICKNIEDGDCNTDCLLVKFKKERVMLRGI